MKAVLTTCAFCGCGCRYYLLVRGEKVVGVSPAPGDPVSEGRLCVKGWNSFQFINHPERLKRPLVRDGGGFREASWDEALELVAERLSGIKERHGPDSLAFLSSAKCTNEENYLMMKLARAVFSTNNVDHCARLCHASTVVGLASTFGSGAMTNSISEIEDSDCILVTGSNTTEQHPLVAARVLRALKKGARLIVVDPRRIQLSKLATLHLRQRPGTDVAWLNGMMYVILDEGLEKRDFIEERTEGFEELEKVVSHYSPGEVERITGIPARDLVEAARLYGRAERASIIYSMGITQHTTGVDNVRSCANLAMLTGNVGRYATGVNPLRGQNNVQGACDVGALPDVLSGYQKVSDPEVRDKFERAWGVKLPQDPGLTVVEMIESALRGEVRAMYIMGENPMLSDPDVGQVERGLGNLEFLVVQDIFLSETARLADVVLPAASFAEKDGTFTNTERRVMRIRKALDPPGRAKADWEILCDLARKLGADWDYGSPSEIFDEIASLTPIYHGISYRRLEGWGIQWPCPSEDHPGTPYLHKGKFARGKGKFIPARYRPPDELPSEEYPFVLTTGRVYFHWHTGTMTRRISVLDREVPRAFVEVNPEDAGRLGIRDGARVKVSSRRGEVEVEAKVTDVVPEGVVFMPFHFLEAAANRLTNPALDPEAMIPEYKVCAVRIERSEGGR
ncbi:MAG: formate dehydrogenase subunit alpha [Candidatus Latescibacterota bacterium]|nr:MAG: formate dehydrogenase subunit alpha [Candidatus Latescibacterota bacterium]RKY74698.1 MAG: formate dehydrogenase subunit alpha [Candidatus Latescibacterota bacterium]HDH99809.1 formate dehydrogenase subunit alpha [Bacillota bacterium]